MFCSDFEIDAGKAEADGNTAEADEAIEADADEMDDAANEAIVANTADDSKNEADGVLDNQLAELEKLDAVNKAIVSNEAGEADAVNKSDLF